LTLIDDLKKLEPLAFWLGCTEAKAVQVAYAGGQAYVAPEMKPRIRFDVTDTIDGQYVGLRLTISLDFRDCALASSVGQPSLLVQVIELTPESLDALDFFVAARKRDTGFPTRWLDTSDDPPGEVTQPQ
jgi:hypothetical protein